MLLEVVSYMSSFGRRGGDKERGRGRVPTTYGGESPRLPLSPSPTLQMVLMIVAVALAGCPSNREAPAPPAKDSSNATAPRASVTLRLVVVNARPLAEAINRLRGEWAERSGGELAAQAVDWKDVADAKQLDADAIIFPSRYLGELCRRGWLRPVRGSVLDAQELKFADFFPLVRNELLKWGGETMALPLGIDATSFTSTSSVASRRPALALLLEAGPVAITNEKLGFLFDTETMKPRITERAFLEALTRLKQSAAPGENDVQAADSQNATAGLPLLGWNDRLISVSASTHNAASAFRLIAWLAQPEASTQLAHATEKMMPARSSLANSPQWYDPAISPEDRKSLSERLVTQLNGERCILVPRLPGIDDYLAALDEAVEAAIGDKMTPGAALQAAAVRWEAITDAAGRSAQRVAYLKHLNVAE